jgi:tRNA (adenine22-N1)-methyltransferase
MNKRIDYLSNFIKKANYVIDIGCDHGYLSVLLLKKEIANHVINIDINKKPLDSAISNLTKNNLLDKTTNIINDGLKNLNFDFVIDYCFISGLGSKTIINIIENNENIIENFILQTNTNSLDLRKYLLKNNFEIISEDKIVDNNI